VPSGGWSYPHNVNDNDYSEGEEDMQGSEQGTRNKKGTKDGRRKWKTTENGKRKRKRNKNGYCKEKGIVNHMLEGDDISRAIVLQLLN